MDPLWLGLAFVLGFAVKQIGLPPLVGYLGTGFILNFYGIESGETLNLISDLGILLLLFSIGLKLNVKSLFRPEIWATASIHMALIIALFGSIIFAIGYSGLTILGQVSSLQALIISFALSFSSTVFAVKILEEKGAMKSTHGRIAVGVLVMQDIFAVIFLTFTADAFPSLWALLLVGVLGILVITNSKPISILINRTGHGELFMILGVLIPLIAAALFKATGLKADLGALVMGILLANHSRAKELSDSMLNFKDLFLVGFFLSIGINGSPTWTSLGIAALLTLVIPVKTVLFFALFTKFKLRVRTALLSSFVLTNYSEFGLIVGAASVSKGWLNQEWLVIFAIALALSFVAGAGINTFRNKLYVILNEPLKPYEHPIRLAEDEAINLAKIEVIVLGMGRVGSAVHDVMCKKYGDKVLGVDYNPEVAKAQREKGVKIIHGSAIDYEFWQRITDSDSLKLAVLAMSNHSTHMQVIGFLKSHFPEIKLAGLCRFEDEIDDLNKAGVDIVFNLYSEAGRGYANHINNFIKDLG